MNQIFLLLTLFLLSCNSQTVHNEKQTVKNTENELLNFQKSDNSKYYTSKDTLLIDTGLDDTLKFTKDNFNKIVDEHPEFFSDLTYNPEYLHHLYGRNVTFGSEQGQDVYFVLYAYFLKQKQGTEKFREQRTRFIQIYAHINSLFGHLQYGGSYFGHQSFRIAGYAEFSVYLYTESREYIEKTYNISRQKELYIQSLRQLIADESTIDFETLGEEKQKRIQKLNKIVDELDDLITEIFYLRRAQQFQYDNYEYY